MNKKRITPGLVVVILAIAALIVLPMTVVSTYPNEYKLIRQFGKVERIITEPGLSFKIPYLQNTMSIPKSTQIYDIPPSDVITKDKKTMVADCFVLWKVREPIRYLTTLNGQESAAEARINTIVYNSLKNVISSMPQSEVISGRDGELAQAIMDSIGSSMNEYGIVITAVETKSLDLPDDNKASVYERMISERNNIAASYTAEGNSEATKIRTETDTSIQIQLSEARAEAEKIEAEGEAEYMNILSKAYNDESKADFYVFVRALDAAKSTMKSGNKTLIIDRDSPLASIFYPE